MRLSLQKNDLIIYIKLLLNNHFPDNHSTKLNNDNLSSLIDDTLDKIEFCFKNIRLKYYNINNDVSFNHLHTDHMCMFLCYMAHVGYQRDYDELLLNKISYLNKILHGLDIWFNVKLPDILLMVHPIGTVIGNAKFSDFIEIHQNVTIGSSFSDMVYPSFGRGICLYPNSSIIGTCNIGDNVTFGINSSIINTDIPSNKQVVGQYPDNRIIDAKIDVVNEYFGHSK
tara:strand:+ start:1566 stop:2243 length:678 start_codon:yes stop_codon:yes gene_type:complete